MSIIFIDDVLFNDNKEERTIHNGNCLLFIALNSVSIISGILYLSFYYITPYYQKSNTLSLYLSIFHLILNIFYCIIFLEIYLYNSLYLPFSIKIITMFNPLIVFCIYYWTVCLTHNLYALYFKYMHNINKQVKLYKYLLFIVSIVLYIYTLINLQYNDSLILSKTFYLINNYNNSFIGYFYFCGLLMIIYIIIKLYYILQKKKEIISINEYQENKEKNDKIIKILNSVLTINLSFIIYFLLSFTPTTILMLFKYCLSHPNINIYFIDFTTAFLISFSGTFIFCIRLLNPLMRTFIFNLMIFNRDFFSNYKEKLLNGNESESFDENNISEIYNIYKNNFSNNTIKRDLRKTKTIQANGFSLNFGKKTNKDNDGINRKKFEILKIINKNKIYEMDELNEENNSNLVHIKENMNLEIENNRIQNEIKLIELKKKEEEKEETRENTKEMITINKSINNLEKENNIIDGKNALEFPINPIKKDIITNSQITNNSNQKLYKRNQSLRRRNTTVINSLKSINSPIASFRKRVSTKTNESLFKEELSSFDLINLHLEMNDNLIRLIAISIAINDCRIYDEKEEYKKYYCSTIPWDNKNFYNERTDFKEYNEKTIPNWIFINNEIKLNNLEFKILSFCPFVFHHIRLIDNISIDDILSSLEPFTNMKTIQNMKVSGGRGGNSIIYSWDKKYILKTADDSETNILIEKMIIDYHCLMKQSITLLSRVYGVFKIELKDKGSINVIIQRNMNDLPNQTKLLTFDFKGSTVDRQSIRNEDTKLNQTELFNIYKNTVLKDIDIGIIGLEINLDINDYENLMAMIDSDSMFLQNFEVTDYSLIVFVHKYRKEDIINNKNNSRICRSKDNKYLFNFAIVDFLGSFNIGKKGEKLAKELVGYIKKLKDTNFSVLDPERYAIRFRNFAKRIIS